MARLCVWLRDGDNNLRIFGGVQPHIVNVGNCVQVLVIEDVREAIVPM